MEPSLRFATAQDLFDAFPTAQDDIRARPNGESSLQFIAGLVKGDTPEESVTFSAYLLPRRKAVWWGHQCVGSLIHLLSDQDLRLLQLAEDWVREPEEDRRVVAMDEGMAVRSKSPGVWIALAAGWSGGSLAPVGMPKVPPPPYLTARAVNTGILGALARVENRHREPTLRAFVDMGVSLATR
jgi:hypothetical protein